MGRFNNTCVASHQFRPGAARVMAGGEQQRDSFGPGRCLPTIPRCEAVWKRLFRLLRPHATTARLRGVGAQHVCLFDFPPQHRMGV